MAFVHGFYSLLIVGESELTGVMEEMLVMEFPDVKDILPSHLDYSGDDLSAWCSLCQVKLIDGSDPVLGQATSVKKLVPPKTSL